MKKLCKAHHIKHEHKMCKAHSPNLCETHKTLAKSEGPATDDCPYCTEQKSNHSDCPYCAEMDSKQSDDHSDCPYCQELDSGQGDDHDGCPYCAEMDQSQDHQCNCPNCPKNEQDQQGLQSDDAMGAAPDNSNDTSDSPHDCPECQKMYGDAIENQPGQTGQEPPKTQGHETAAEVLDMLDQEPGTGMPPSEVAQKIDNTEMPQGDQMEDGTSVTENFGDAQRADVSDADKAFGEDCNCPDCPGHAQEQQPEQSQEQLEDDQPDMASVLQNGLDEHASEQKRAMVIDQVAQTLQGFKANKEMLEATKEQNMPLYQSTIQMLKAMIALCDLLGLQPQMPEQAPMQAAPQGEPSQTPSPSAAPQEGAAQDPKN